jgi:hypothetical protein
MNQQTRLRSLGSLLVLVLVVILNSLMVLTEQYGPAIALPIYAVTGLVLIIALRYQRQLSRWGLVLMQILPVALILIAFAAVG